MNRIIESWSAEMLYQKRSLIQYPDYQREPTVWNQAKRQLLIDSMLKGLDIPKIYLFKSKNNQYDVIDGRQRIESLFEFFDGYLTLPDRRDWDHLSLKEREIISNYEFTLAIITQATEEELRLLFLRLQLGAPLNVGEKLNAIKGQLHDFVFDIGKNHPFFIKVRIPNRRFAKETVFATICINSFYRAINGIFYGGRYEELAPFFENFKDLSYHQKQVTQIKETLDDLNKLFGERLTRLKNRAVIVSCYLFFEELRMKKDIDLLSKFTDFYILFVDTLNYQTAKGLEYDHEYREILDFQSLIIQAAVSRSSIESRHKMIKDYFDFYMKTGTIKTM